MDLARLHPISLFLLWIPVAAALVHPPANVTLHCHNLTNILMWDYHQLTPGIKFLVNVMPYSGDALEFWVEPPDLKVDLSFLPNLNEEFYLTVTAVMGEDMSSPSPDGGMVFTYSEASVTNHKCYMDLPPVNVTAQPHDQVHFIFEHPWLLYRQKLQGNGKSKHRKRKSHDALLSEQLPVFTYDVELIDQKWSHRYHCKNSVCEDTLPVNVAKKKNCLKINGELNLMAVKSKQEYCATPFEEPPFHNYIYIIVGTLALTTFAVVGYMVYRKKTRPTSSTLRSLKFSDDELTNRTMGPIHEQTHTVEECEPTTPTPLLTTTLEEDVREFTPVNADDDDMRLCIGMPSNDESVPDVIETEEPNVEGSEYMQGHNLEEGSNYERRPVLLTLAPDETAEGYRG